MSRIEQRWADEVASIIAPHGTPIFVALKGSRLWGINEPDADVDLRGVYIARTEDFFGFSKPPQTIERTIMLAPDADALATDTCHTPAEGVKLDIVVYEVEHFFKLITNNNGNMIESCVVPDDRKHMYEVRRSMALHFFGELLVTDELYKFFRGYAFNQFTRASTGGSAKRGGVQARTGKNIIACYREMFLGIHLMVTGKFCWDWPALMSWVQEQGFSTAVVQSVINNRDVVSDATLNAVRDDFSLLDDWLTKARETTPLEGQWDGARNRAEALLRTWRMQQLRFE